MNIRTTYALLVLLTAAGTITVSSAYAQEPSLQEKAEIVLRDEVPVTAKADKAVYAHGETIRIQGKVANIASGFPVTITVTSPTNNVVKVDQINVDNKGYFATSLNTAGYLWKQDGTYIIKVQYGNNQRSDRILVELAGGTVSGPSESTQCSTNEIAATGYCIPYTISTGTVKSATIDTNQKSIVIRIDSLKEGTLTLNPSKSIIDGIFMVLVDGQEWDDVEIKGNQVTIMFPAGAEEIEIIGTFVVPEFGAVAALILAVAIISIIAVSARSRLSLIPKF